MQIKPYIIKDTREKSGQGWNFVASKHFAGMKEQKIDTGDYSLEGLEHLICIERKGSITEFANNIVQDRFERELERMKDIPHKYIILEFDMDEIMGYPFNQKLPKALKRKIKIRGTYILRKILEFQQKYGVFIILAGEYGQEVALSIFKRILAPAH